MTATTLLLSAGLLFGAPVPKDLAKSNTVVIETSMGTIEVELFPEKAPKTVANFLKYADDGFFDGLAFHRVIPNFMIQGGGHDKAMALKKAREPIMNESANGLSNARGTISMARTAAADSATSQFFINIKDNKFLDFANDKPGYCVFGKVTQGMDVVDKISGVEKGIVAGHNDVPTEPVVFKSVRRGK